MIICSNLLCFIIHVNFLTKYRVFISFFSSLTKSLFITISLKQSIVNITNVLINNYNCQYFFLTIPKSREIHH